MSRIGRTCKVPTEAWAYQVPSVPCLRKTCVSESVYSARFSSGTAQSSMKETGLPSPFIDIMMLRPAFLTSHTSRWSAASTMRITLPGLPRSAISAARCSSLSVGRVRARQADHRPIHELDRGRCELDYVLGCLHRLPESPEMAHAQGPEPGQGRELQMDPLGIRERAFGADQELREVPFAAGIHKIQVVSLHAPQHLRPARFDFSRLALGDGAHLLRELDVAGVARKARNIG